MYTDDEPVPFSEAFAVGDRLSDSWSALKRFFPVLFVGGCLKSCTEGGSGGGNWDKLLDDKDQSGAILSVPHHFAWNQVSDALSLPVGVGGVGGAELAVIAVILVVALFVVLAVLAFRAWIVPGWLRLHREILETGNGTFGTLFSGADRFLPMVGWIFLESAIMLGTVTVACIPGGVLAALGAHQNQDALLWGGIAAMVLLGLPTFLYVALGVLFGELAVSLESLGPVDALGRAWSLASGNRINLFGYLLLMTIVRVFLGLTGLCACIIGIFVTGPSSVALYDFSLTQAFLLTTRPRTETERWSIRSWAS